MTRRCRLRRGFKLIDMMVAVFVVGIAIGLLMPAVNTNCTVSRRTQCQNNMRNIGLGLVQFYTARNVFPQAGTFFDDPEVHQGDPARSSIDRAIIDPAAFAKDLGPLRHNWVVTILPYLDNQELFNAWDFKEPYLSTVPADPTLPSNATISDTSIWILRCPNDPSVVSGKGNLSYAVNGGFVRWHAIPVSWEGDRPGGKPGNGEVLRWAPEGRPWTETQAVCRKLGVMSPGTTTGDQPWDVRTTPSAIADGAATTLMLGENMMAGSSTGTRYSGDLPTNWACPLPNFSMFLASDDVCQGPNSTTDCLGGQLRPTSAGLTGPGWSRANRPGKGEGINGASAKAIEGSYPYALSGHDGGANFVFCDGSVRFLKATIDGGVYARLITPAGERLPLDLRQTPVKLEEIEP